MTKKILRATANNTHKQAGSMGSVEKSDVIDRVLVKPVERRVKAMIDRTKDNAVMLARAYERQEGLSGRQSMVVRFMDWFPYNVATIFMLAIALFASIYTVITFSIGSHSISKERVAEIESAKVRQLALIHAADRANDDEAFARATLALQQIENDERAPAALESAVLSLISLVIAVTGIFSLPLITSATMKLMGTRLVAANAALQANQRPAK